MIQTDDNQIWLGPPVRERLDFSLVRSGSFEEFFRSEILVFFDRVPPLAAYYMEGK